MEESGLGLLVDFSDSARAAGQIEGHASRSRAQQHMPAVRKHVGSKMLSVACAERYLDLLSLVAVRHT